MHVSLLNQVEKENTWHLKNRVTTGIKMSCKLKQELYLNSWHNSEVTKVDYLRYCKILTDAIKDVKHGHYNKQILKSKSSMGDCLNRNNCCTSEGSPSVKLNDNILNNLKILANSSIRFCNDCR
jgi:hypothetical protein